MGGALHNRTLEPQRFEWILAPMFGTRSGKVLGMGGFKYRSPSSKGRLEQSTLGVSYQRFSDFTLARTNEPYDYHRVAFRFDYTLRHAPITQKKSGGNASNTRSF